MKHYRFFLIAVALLVLIGCAFAARKQMKTMAQEKLPAVAIMMVSSGAMEANVMAEGMTVSHDSVNVTVLPGFEARVLRVQADIGTHVVSGQVLAELDAADEKTRLDKAVAAAQAAEQAYRLVLVPHRPEEIEQMRSRLDADKQTIDQAQNRLIILVKGSRPQEIVRAQQAVKSAAARNTEVSTDHARNQALFAQELISKADMGKSDMEQTVAAGALEEAKQALSLLQEGARPEEIAMAREELERARSSEKDHRLSLAVLLQGSRPEEIHAAADHVAEAQAGVRNETIIYEHRFVRAPIAGVITERNINPGEVAGPGSVRSTITDPKLEASKGLFVISGDHALEFLADVDQKFYQNVHVGQTAEIGIEALPGRSFPGQVSRIDPLVNTSRTQEATSPFTFSVWVQMADTRHLLVPGQVGVLRIKHRQSGLIVPQSAVNSFTLGEGTVFTERAGMVHIRSVKYDDSGDGNISILSGLGHGDQVVVSPTAGLTEGMKVQPYAADSSSGVSAL